MHESDGHGRRSSRRTARAVLASLAPAATLATVASPGKEVDRNERQGTLLKSVAPA